MTPQIKYALVTGASSGIGLAYSRELAARGINLVLASNQKKELNELKKFLEQEFSIHAHAYCIDLGLPNSAQELFDFCIRQKIQVDLLINNAGFLLFEPFCKTATKKIESMLYLHIFTVTMLCKLFAAEMKRRGYGFIINMSSLSAWMSMPGITVYNSTKSYVKNFSLSLYYELYPHNVKVTVICPGAIDTELFGLDTKLRALGRKLRIISSPQKLVKLALKKNLRGDPQVIPGILNYFFIFLIMFLPRRLVFFLAKKFPQLRDE